MSLDSKPDPVLRPRVAAALQRLKDSREAGALEVVGEIVSQLLGCEEHALLALEQGGARLRPVLAMGLTQERLEALRVPMGIIGQVALHGVPYVRGRTSSIGAVAYEEGLSACIPLMQSKQVYGVLALFGMFPQKRGFSDEDLELLDLLSVQGGIMLSEPQPGTILLRASAPEPLPVAESGALRTVYLDPGGVVVAASPTEVTTILGSCVAVCLWDEQLRLGGMNHFLFPTSPDGKSGGGRHGDTAIPLLLKELERLGSQRQHLRAKVFGGASMVIPPESRAAPVLGQRNADLARRLLAEAGIPIIAEDLGGTVGRKLRFRTDDGSAVVKMLGAG